MDDVVLEDLKIEKVDGWGRDTHPYKPYDV
jgi:hypothetical protein